VRKGFYEDYASWEELYKLAFGVVVSENMNNSDLLEFTKQAKRLNTWIGELKNTHKGKIASKNGAGRRNNRLLSKLVSKASKC
jgi:hypothetical protein